MSLHRSATGLGTVTGIALFSLTASFGGAAVAQVEPPIGHWDYRTVRSGNCDNPYPVETVVFQHIMTLDRGIPWLRVHFSKARLDHGSHVRLTSLFDGDIQTMHQVHLEQWEFGTAFFNGNAVLIELVAGPSTRDNVLEIERVWAGDPPTARPDPETICGAQDNRVPSNDARVGRLLTSGLRGGCTGWIIDEPSRGNDRCHLSAGHCFPGSRVLQFNVPASNANCALNHPPAALQFAVNVGTMVFVDNGIGDDYAVFRCFPNPNTNLTTFQTQGAAFTITAATPALQATVRVTGFGVDGTTANNAAGANSSCNCNNMGMTGQRNQTQQTDTGPLTAAMGNTAGHQVDTCGANSGSPIINEATGAAFGIHTNGGCINPVGNSQNSGTLIRHAGLQRAIGRVCEPPECYLMVGFGSASTPLLDDPVDVLRLDPLAFQEVSQTTVPDLAVPTDPGLAGVHLYFQVVMFNPAEYPLDPLQLTNGLDAVLGGGMPTTYGPRTTMDIWAVGPATLGGVLQVRFTVPRP